MRELSISLENIHIRDHNANAFLANIHGRKMDYIIPDSAPPDFTKEQNTAAEKAIKAAFERKKLARGK